MLLAWLGRRASARQSRASKQRNIFSPNLSIRPGKSLTGIRAAKTHFLASCNLTSDVSHPLGKPGDRHPCRSVIQQTIGSRGSDVVFGWQTFRLPTLFNPQSLCQPTLPLPTRSHRERGSPHWSCNVVHIWAICQLLNGENSQRQHSILKAFPSSGTNHFCQLPDVEMVMTDISGGVDQSQLLMQDAVTVDCVACLEAVGLHVPQR